MTLAFGNALRPYQVEHVASATDGEGRMYARQGGGQNMPKALRLVLFGEGRQEIDMTGALWVYSSLHWLEAASN